eukprot:3439397-Pleurochrysis_carterae.AAC.1
MALVRTICVTRDALEIRIKFYAPGLYLEENICQLRTGHISSMLHRGELTVEIGIQVRVEAAAMQECDSCFAQSCRARD